MAVAWARRRWRIACAMVAALVLVGAVTAPVGAVRSDDADPPGLLLSFDVATGHEQWRVTTPPVLDLVDVSTDAVVGRALSCATGHFRTVAYRAQDGRKRWEHSASRDGITHQDATGSGADRSGVVVVALKTQVQGRDASSGVLRWHFAVPAFSWVEVTADAVYVGADANRSGVVEAFERSSGRPRWKTTVAPRGSALGSPAVQAGARVAAASVTHENAFPINMDVNVLDSSSGRRLWQASGTPLSADDGVVTLFHHADTNPATVEARDAISGKALWQRNSEARLVQQRGGLVVLEDTSTIAALDALTGELRWVRSGTATWLVVGTTAVVYATGQNELVALDVHTGSELWHAVLPGDAPANNTASLGVGAHSVFITRGCSPTD